MIFKHIQTVWQKAENTSSPWLFAHCGIHGLRRHPLNATLLPLYWRLLGIVVHQRRRHTGLHRLTPSCRTGPVWWMTSCRGVTTLSGWMSPCRWLTLTSRNRGSICWQRRRTLRSIHAFLVNWAKSITSVVVTAILHSWFWTDVINTLYKDMFSFKSILYDWQQLATSVIGDQCDRGLVLSGLVLSGPALSGTSVISGQHYQGPVLPGPALSGTSVIWD